MWLNRAAPVPACYPQRNRLVLRADLFVDFAAFVEKLNHRIPFGINADDYAIPALLVLYP